MKTTSMQLLANRLVARTKVRGRFHLSPKPPRPQRRGGPDEPPDHARRHAGGRRGRLAPLLRTLDRHHGCAYNSRDALENRTRGGDRGQCCAQRMDAGARGQSRRRRPPPTHRAAGALARAGTDHIRLRSPTFVGGKRRRSHRRRHQCPRRHACPGARDGHRRVRRLAERVRPDHRSRAQARRSQPLWSPVQNTRAARTASRAECHHSSYGK